MTVSHTSAQMTISRIQPGEIYLDAGDSMTLHLSGDVRVRLGDALLSEDLAMEAAAMRKLVAVAAQAAGELDRRAAVGRVEERGRREAAAGETGLEEYLPGKPPAGETANALCGPDNEVAPASFTRPDTQLSPGLSGHSPAGPPDDDEAADTFPCDCGTRLPWPDRGEDQTCPQCGAVWENDGATLGAGARIKRLGRGQVAIEPAGTPPPHPVIGQDEHEPDDDDQPVSYLACGDSLDDDLDHEPGERVECPRHGEVAVVDPGSWTAAALDHPDDPGDSGPEPLPAPAGTEATS